MVRCRRPLCWHCRNAQLCVSGLGVPATQSIPMIIGGSVLFGAILGVILLGEILMLHGWSGILTLVIGIICITLDPGEKVKEGGVVSDIISIDEPPVYWVLIALICANAYAFYNIFIKKGSSSIDPILGGTKLIYNRYTTAIHDITESSILYLLNHRCYFAICGGSFWYYCD